MKLSKFILAGALATAFAVSAQAATYHIVVTGATTFRDAFHNAVLNAFPGASWVADQASATADGGIGKYQIYMLVNKPSTGDTTYVQTSFAGSGSGISNVAKGTSVNVIDETKLVSFTNGLQTISTAGASGATAWSPSVARVAFSDVFQANTTAKTPVLNNEETVGIVPFIWVCSTNAPAGLTNVTSQNAANILGGGQMLASQMTGNVDDSGTIVTLLGRKNDSGTRITTVMETGYGASNPLVGCKNYLTVTGTSGADNGKIVGYTASSPADNIGGSSNGANMLAVATAPGSAFTDVLLSYIGVGDLPTGALVNSVRQLSYNGVAYSPDAIYNGAYTYWGYEHVYKANNWNVSGQPEGTSTVVWNAIKTGLAATLSPFGLDASLMTVSRGNDGATVAP